MNPVFLLLDRLTALVHRLDNYDDILSAGGEKWFDRPAVPPNVIDISDPVSVNCYLTENYFCTRQVYRDICRLLERRGICYRDEVNRLRPLDDYNVADLRVLMDLTKQCEKRMDRSRVVLDMIQLN